MGSVDSFALAELLEDWRINVKSVSKSQTYQCECLDHPLPSFLNFYFFFTTGKKEPSKSQLIFTWRNMWKTNSFHTKGRWSVFWTMEKPGHWPNSFFLYHIGRFPEVSGLFVVNCRPYGFMGCHKSSWSLLESIVSILSLQGVSATLLLTILLSRSSIPPLMPTAIH